MAGSTEIQLKENPDRKKAVRVFVFYKNLHLSEKTFSQEVYPEDLNRSAKYTYRKTFPGEMRKETK